MHENMEFRDKSFWLGHTEYQEAAPLGEDIEVDIAIVGGGFTGLSSAYYLKQHDPSLSIAVLESQVVGYGASGRNGGFSMPLMGWNISYLIWLFGQERGTRAHHFMLDCVRHTRDLVQKENLDCDLEYNGLLVLAGNDQQLRQLETDMRYFEKAGVKDVELLTGEAFRSRLNSAWHKAAIYEPDTAILNPAKLAREMKRVVVDKGVKIYERTPVLKLDPGSTVTLDTPEARVKAKKVVLGLNAFATRINVRKNVFVPMFTYIILTEPLSDDLYEQVGWTRREGIEDKRQLVHYMRMTADNRLLIGGRDAPYYYGNQLENRDSHAKIFQGLEDDLKGIFPMLKQTKISHRWGGPVAITPMFVPTFGYHKGHKNIVYGQGYCGHGVALSTASGQIIRDLLYQPDSDYIKDLLFIHNTPGYIPPERLRYFMVNGVCKTMNLYDKWVERNGPK